MDALTGERIIVVVVIVVISAGDRLDKEDTMAHGTHMVVTKVDSTAGP